MKEIFAKPAVGAIIEKRYNGRRCLLLQVRDKENGGADNGLTEIPAGKMREYESVFDALRREVREETGLTLTHIQGEAEQTRSENGSYITSSYTPYCVTQNFQGGYSLILQTFLCTAEGEPVFKTDETRDIRWVPAEEVEAMLAEKPESFFPMHINALKKYFSEFPAR